jgi:hypothetical protein
MSEEMLPTLNELKKKVFFDLLKLAGRVFVLVRYSDSVVIGKRGFLPEEREKGLVLVFNKSMTFTWDDSGISAKLAFGTTSESCFIPQDDVVSVFSPELLVQFTVSPEEKHAPGVATGRREEKKQKKAARDKVVRVDFTRKK